MINHVIYLAWQVFSTILTTAATVTKIEAVFRRFRRRVSRNRVTADIITHYNSGGRRKWSSFCLGSDDRGLTTWAVLGDRDGSFLR